MALGGFDLLFGFAATVAEITLSIGRWIKGSKPIRSGTHAYPTPADVFREMLTRLIERKSEGFADFRLADADEPWVQVALGDGDLAVNFFYPFEAHDALRVMTRHGIHLPKGSLDHVAPGKAASYLIPMAAQVEVVELAHALFKTLYHLGEVYTLTGTLET